MIVTMDLYPSKLTALFVMNLIMLAGVAKLATDPQLDWHDWLYPAFTGAALLIGVELLAFRWFVRPRDAKDMSSDGWLWIISLVLLAATVLVWEWTNSNHNIDLEEIARQRSAPTPVRLDTGNLQKLQPGYPRGD